MDNSLTKISQVVLPDERVKYWWVGAVYQNVEK
jgi:hypothetical protein